MDLGDSECKLAEKSSPGGALSDHCFLYFWLVSDGSRQETCTYESDKL